MNDLMRLGTGILFLIVAIATYGCNTDNINSVYDLRCENLHNPLGTDQNWKGRKYNRVKGKQSIKMTIFVPSIESFSCDAIRQIYFASALAVS